MTKPFLFFIRRIFPAEAISKGFALGVLLFSALPINAQEKLHPCQPPSGPGAAEYCHSAVTFSDNASRATGYWLFEPAAPRPDSADVVVFLHGYGAYNPMAYGKWIKHLVARGNIVIYPRYQHNLIFPHAQKFPRNAARGIRDAIAELSGSRHVRPRIRSVLYIGHSYGGTIAAHLGVHWQKFGVPKPAAMLLCEPGTGPLKGARLSSYHQLPADLALVIVTGHDDSVVGEAFGRLVFETAANTPNRNLVIQHRDTDGRRYILASHSEPYSCDLDFDTGVRNYTAKRVLQYSRLNEVDVHCYWKFADALMDFTRKNCSADFCFGNTAAQRYLGRWSDGTPIRELEIITPFILQVAE